MQGPRSACRTENSAATMRAKQHIIRRDNEVRARLGEASAQSSCAIQKLVEHRTPQ